MVLPMTHAIASAPYPTDLAGEFDTNPTMGRTLKRIRHLRDRYGTTTMLIWHRSLTPADLATLFGQSPR
jgi:hypothetical protein